MKWEQYLHMYLHVKFTVVLKSIGKTLPIIGQHIIEGPQVQNVGLKSQDTSHIETLVRRLVPYKLNAKAKVTLLEKQKEFLLNWIVPITKSRIRQLRTNLIEVTSGKIAAEKQFSSISATYDRIALTMQNSRSNVLEEELKKQIKTMGGQLGSMQIDL